VKQVILIFVFFGNLPTGIAINDFLIASFFGALKSAFARADELDSYCSFMTVSVTLALLLGLPRSHCSILILDK